ncbi:MAG: DUF3857 domain-containing protein, partial [Actinobacteria bacterium]|nr:DUF3857 domain-containing protein [Actinomycetota bacterium]
VKLHTLCLVRNNLEIIDLLKVENIQVVDSTQNHDNNIFDGQKILLILLQGLQVGDVIVSAYTTQRPYTSNAPKYSASINLNYLVPCAKVYRRVVSDVTEKLNYKLFNSSDSLAIKTDDFGNVSEIVFAKTNVTSVNFEDGLPAWNCPLAFLQVSTYDSWAEVAGLIYKFYMPMPQASTLIQELCATFNSPEIKCATFNSPESDLESNIINALRWVQNQIKYTSLELGDNNGLPVSPEIVLQRKFGDCKDKALLFLTILKEMQVEAYPVLIDSFSRIFKNCDDFLPSSLYFNHIIVKIVLNDVAYYVDPTRVFQYGSLNEYKQANIGAVLVLNPFAKKLEHSYAEIPPSPYSNFTACCN